MAEEISATNQLSSQAQPNSQSTAPNQMSSGSSEAGQASVASEKTSPAPLKSPLIPDPKAFLERARARHGISPSKTADGQSRASEIASSANSAAQSGKPTPQSQSTSSQSNGANPGNTTHSAEASVSSTSATTTDPVDEMAATVAKLSREKRDLEAQRRTFAEEQARAKAEREETAKQHAVKLAQAETVEKAVKAIENGDVAGAMKLLKADVNPSALALQLLEQLQKEDERPMSQAEVDRMIAERLKAEQATREKADEERRKADAEKQKAEQEKVLNTAKENYVNACNLEFSREKFPFVAKRGISSSAILEYAMSVKDDAGRLSPPSPEDVLRHFEARYKEDAQADGYELVPKVAKPAQQAVSPSFSQSTLAQDSGGRLAVDKPRTTLEEDRAALRRRLRIGGVQT